MNVRTKGFCLALLRCGEIKLIAEKRNMPFRTLSRILRERSFVLAIFAIRSEMAYCAFPKRRRTKSFGTQSSLTL